VIWWIVGGLVVGSLVLLAVAALALLGRLREFGYAARRLQRLAEEAQRRTLPKVAAVQERAATLQEQIMTVQERAERMRAARVVRRDS
jgi:hypothetical protein